MKRWGFLCAAAALILVLSAPLMARAQEGVSQQEGAGKWYWKFNVGILSPRDLESTAPPSPTLNADIDTGVFVSTSVGRSFGRLRGEVEVLYGEVDYTLDATTRGVNGDVVDITRIGGEFAEFEAKITGLMFNAWFDLGASDWALNPYVGGGVGVMHLDVPRGTDSGFSWQLGAGAIFPIGNNLALDASYRFLNTAYEPEIFSIVYEDIEAHAFLLGIKLTF